MPTFEELGYKMAPVMVITKNGSRKIKTSVRFYESPSDNVLGDIWISSGLLNDKELPPASVTGFQINGTSYDVVDTGRMEPTSPPGNWYRFAGGQPLNDIAVLE